MPECRECGVELIKGENWWPSFVQRNDRICTECKQAYLCQWRHAHKEEVREYNHQYHVAHQAERLERARLYYEAHGEEKAEYDRQYHVAHREERAGRNRQWAKANPDKKRENEHRHRARKANATIGPVDEVAIYELYNHACIYCGAIDDLTLDHIVSLFGGGPHCEDNLVVACRRCNSSKHTRPLIEWLQTQPYSQVWVM